MAERPILFNAEMVRAILDGRKRQTRRLVKPRLTKNEAGWRVCKSADGRAYAIETFDDEEFFQGYVVPPVQRGDVLWVRETWCNVNIKEYPSYFYKADNNRPSDFDITPWRPSIHMPREAARLFLKVGDVRIERLRDIDADGIRAEGLASAAVHCGDMEIALKEWALLWNSTVNKADLPRYGWEANPWVWVFEFERV